MATFETIDLASFYTKNGSEFSNIKPVNSPAEKVGKDGISADKTPVSKLAEMVNDMGSFPSTPTKTGIDGNPFPATPTKAGIDSVPFGATPTKDGIDGIPFGASPEKTTLDIFPMPVSAPKIGIDSSAFSFTPAFTGTDTSAFSFIPGFAGTDTTPFGFVPGFSTPSLAIVNSSPDIDATGFTANQTNPDTQFTGIDGTTFQSNKISTQLKTRNGIPDIDASGFTPNQTNPNTDFKGISGNTFESQRLSTQLKVHNGIADIDMSGFITNKGHYGPTDFKGITGDPGTMQFKMNTDNPGSTYAWTRTLYNDKVTGAENNIEDKAATGFTKYNKGQYKGGVSSFIGMAEGEANGNKYTYPINKSFPNGSYNFNSFMMSDVAVGAKQQFSVLARTGPGIDTNIDAKQHRYSNNQSDGIKLSGQWEDRVNNLYTSIPGKGKTDLRKESSNFGSWGNATDQPFILRDIGSNWSLFSDGPGPKFGIDLIRGGVGTAINRSLFDAARIGKFLISPKGLMFIVKEIGLQLTNPKVQTDNILGIGANRIYPLGLSTLAQTLTNAIGIHFTRHGLGPLNGQLAGNARYEDNVFQAELAGGLVSAGAGKAAAKDLKIDTGGLDSKVPNSAPSDETPLGDGSPRSNSRLVFLATDLKSGLWGVTGGDETPANASLLNSLTDITENIGSTISSAVPGAFRGMTKVKITRLSDKGFLGPHSVYGIGGTSIYRSTAGIGIGQHLETGGTYADSKYLSKTGQDVWFNQENGEAVDTNPSVAKTYYNSDIGKKYSDQFGSNVSTLANQPGEEGAPSLAYDRMLDQDPSNPFKSKLAIKNEGKEGEIEKRTANQFITSNPTAFDDLGIVNKHQKYGDYNGAATFDGMLDQEGGFQSPITQKFDAASFAEINSPDKFAKITEETDPTGEISQNATLRKYETLIYGKIPVDRSGHKLMDFRELLDGTNKNFERPNGGDSTALPWQAKDRATRFGADYGRLTRLTDGTETAAGYSVDRSSWENSEGTGLQDNSVDISDPENPDYNAEFDDLIRVKFNTIDPDNDEAEALQFRAYLENFSDNINPTWQDVTYVGRTTPTYLFESMDRDISFDLKLAAGTREELIANYKRLNRFIQLISPQYNDGLPTAPMLKFTLGDWFVGIPMIIDSFSMSPSDGSPWELKDGRQLPHHLDLSISGKILFADAKNQEDNVTQALFSRDANYFGAISRDFAPAGIYTPQE